MALVRAAPILTMLGYVGDHGAATAWRRRLCSGPSGRRSKVMGSKPSWSSIVGGGNSAVVVSLAACLTVGFSQKFGYLLDSFVFLLLLLLL